MKLTNIGKSRVYKLYSFLIYAVPMIVLFIVKRKSYTNTSSVIGFFGYIVIALVIIAFKDKFLTLLKNRTLLAVSAGLFIFSLIMRYLADEIMLITAVSLIGALLSTFTDIVADTYYEYGFKITNDGLKVKNMQVGISDKTAWKMAYGGFIADSGDENNE